MEYIVHIGLPKTGSTSLQKALSNNREILHRHGVVYPKIGISGPDRAKHRGLRMVLKGVAPAQEGMTEDWIEKFHDETAGADICILSCEAFSGFRAPEAFTSLIPQDRTRVVMYVREPVAHTVSSYRNRVRFSNLTMSLWEFAQFFKPRFSGVAERWAAVFGRKNILISLYERDRINWDIVSDFANLIGLKELGESLPAMHAYELNPSITGNLLFVKRVMNNFINRKESRSVGGEINDLAYLDRAFIGKMPVNQETVDLIAHRYHEDLQNLERRFGVSIRPRGKPIEAAPYPDPGNLRRDFTRILDFARERNGKLAPLLERMNGMFAKILEHYRA